MGVDYTTSSRKCSKCKVEKPRLAFYKGINDGMSSYCKECMVDYNRRRASLSNFTSHTRDCECGKEKDLARLACEDCLRLDGTGSDAVIIGALRTTDGGFVTAIELARITGYHRDSIFRMIKKMPGVVERRDLPGPRGILHSAWRLKPGSGR